MITTALYALVLLIIISVFVYILYLLPIPVLFKRIAAALIFLLAFLWILKLFGLINY